MTLDNKVKNRLILVLGILTVLFFAGTVNSFTNAQRYKSARDDEMRIRLDAEEKMNKAAQDEQALKKKIEAMSQELTRENTKHETTKKELFQERAIVESLKEELAKVTKLNDRLEAELKAALAAGNAAQIKK